MRHAAKRDTVEPAIVRTLEAFGIHVTRCHVPFDLFCVGPGTESRPGKQAWIEVKDPKRSKRLTKIQIAERAALAARGVIVPVVTNPTEALAVFNLVPVERT